MENLELLKSYALALVGKPYIYGGAGPAFDCSGLVIDILKAGGLGPPHDMNAAQLFAYLKPISQWDKAELGSIAFYGQSVNTITHVAFLISPLQIIEAGGGDKTTTSKEAAQARGAFIRMRRVSDSTGRNGRRDIVAVMLPNYP